MKSWILDIIDLLFPESCTVCEDTLRNSENTICSTCLLALPYSQNSKILSEKFLSNKKVLGGHNLLDFAQKGSVQKLIHQLKYQNKPEIGHFLGSLLGQKLQTGGIVPDVLIPVPIHDLKRNKRGYNQAEEIAKGIAEIINIPVLDRAILKTKMTDTQTKRTRSERFENMIEVFHVENPGQLSGLTIGIVDDVATTGATINALLHVLEQTEYSGAYIMTIAAAQ